MYPENMTTSYPYLGVLVLLVEIKEAKRHRIESLNQVDVHMLDEGFRQYLVAKATSYVMTAIKRSPCNSYK